MRVRIQTPQKKKTANCLLSVHKSVSAPRCIYDVPPPTPPHSEQQKHSKTSTWQAARARYRQPAPGQRTSQNTIETMTSTAGMQRPGDNAHLARVKQASRQGANLGNAASTTIAPSSASAAVIGRDPGRIFYLQPSVAANVNAVKSANTRPDPTRRSHRIDETSKPALIQMPKAARTCW